MANYYCTSRTNYFRVTDEQKYAALYAGLYGSEDSVEDFTEKHNSELWHGFGSEGWMGWRVDPDDEPDCDGMDGFYEALQEILPDDEAFIFMEAGAEKLRYVTGYVVVVTAKKIRYMSLADWAVASAKDMLGNPDFQTKTEY